MSAIQQVLIATVVSTFIYLPSILVASASGESYQGSSASALISLDLNTNGILLLSYNATGTIIDPPEPVSTQYTWLVGGRSNLFSVRMRTLSGSSFSSGSSLANSWIPVNTNLSWDVISSSNISQPSNSKSVSAVLEIAYTNNLTNIIAQSDIYFDTSATTQEGFIP